MEKRTTVFALFLLSAGFLFAQPAEKTALQKLEPLDVFQPENVSHPQISLIFSANWHANHEFGPQNSEVYEVSLADGSIRELTKRQGQDAEPTVPPIF
ncbi:MAG: hypothetical protein HY842_16645 [Bacteroidetes bacterium]|nr:hypothetical protein [Bacteroidota bacterium]